MQFGVHFSFLNEVISHYRDANDLSLPPIGECPMTDLSQAAPIELKIVGILGIDGISSFALTSALEPFAAARAMAQGGARRCYKAVIVGIEDEAFVCDTGAQMKTQHTLKSAPPLDTIIIPGGEVLRTPERRAQIAAWLLDRASTTRRMAAVGAGIYPLAATGLLKGRRVTTHWRLAHEVASAFPELAVTPAVSFLKSGDFFTCGGGGIAAMEMSLAMIEDDCGPKTAFAVARELNIDRRPPGGEQQIELPEYQPGVTERLAELPTWMSSRLHRDLTVEVLAKRACLSQRHFYRLFKQTFKSTPAAFVEQLRINEAQQRLAVQRESVQNVATSVGFKSTTVFRRAFGRQRGVPPSSLVRNAQTERQTC